MQKCCPAPKILFNAFVSEEHYSHLLHVMHMCLFKVFVRKFLNSCFVKVEEIKCKMKILFFFKYCFLIATKYFSVFVLCHYFLQDWGTAATQLPSVLGPPPPNTWTVDWEEGECESVFLWQSHLPILFMIFLPLLGES